MSEAWIIDGVRSPRGRGKPGKGGLAHLHPAAQHGAGVERARGACRFRPRGCRRRGGGLRLGQRRSRPRHRAHVRARRGLAQHGVWRNTASLLWLRSAGGVLRGDGDHGGSPGSGRRRWRRVDVALRADPRERLPRQQRSSLREASDGAPGHLSGPHRHARRLLARATATSTQSEARSARPQAIDEGRFDRSLVPIHNEDGSLALWIATSTLERERHSRPCRSCSASFEKMGTTVMKGYEKTFDEHLQGCLSRRSIQV